MGYRRVIPHRGRSSNKNGHKCRLERDGTGPTASAVAAAAVVLADGIQIFSGEPGVSCQPFFVSRLSYTYRYLSSCFCVHLATPPPSSPPLLILIVAAGTHDTSTSLLQPPSSVYNPPCSAKLSCSSALD